MAQENETVQGELEIDMDAAVDQVSEGLNLGQEPDKEDIAVDTATDTPAKDANKVSDAARTLASAKATAKTAAAAKDTAVITARAAPKSWAKEQHDYWSKIDPKAQEYIELREKQMLDGLEQYKGDSGFGKQMREVTQPYKAMLQAQGVDEPKAVQFLLNAHYRLTNAPAAEKQTYFAQLAKSYGIDIAALKPDDASTLTPEMKALQDKVNGLESALTTREQAALTEARAKVAKDVEQFASDSSHPYFDEVADDIVAMIRAGAELKDAYEKAVWANPVTRQKEITRLNTENEVNLRAKAKEEAEKARKASGSNVRSRDTAKAPTDPLGTMEDTLRATLGEIRSRTH